MINLSEQELDILKVSKRVFGELLNATADSHIFYSAADRLQYMTHYPSSHRQTATMISEIQIGKPSDMWR